MGVKGMTTYQDPPLQSRRASRQGERPEAQPSFAPPQVPRTAAGAGEPLSYVTQNRPPLPGYDTPPARGRRASEPLPQGAPEQGVSEQSAPPQQPSAPSFRPRDFSPEARTAPPAWAPENDRDNGVLDHHTQARAAVVPPAESPAAESPADDVPATDSPAGGSLAAALAGEPSEHTLSRRELRALREAAGITAAPDTTPVIAPPVAAPAPPAPSAFAPQPAAEPASLVPPAPAPSTQLDSAMAEFDALTGRSSVSASPDAPETSRRAGRRAAAQPDIAPEDGVSAFDATFAPPAVAPAPPEAQAPAAFAPEHHAVVLPPEPAPLPPAQLQPAPLVEPISTPPTGERPIGHWTNQSDLDDAEQATRSTVSRTVGSAAITTSALVLPSIPGHDMSTGEVMLTGSISLPSALSATGAHHSIDESDIDHLLDPGDHQMVNTDSVPISAIRAVSSHTSTRGVIAPAKPQRGGRALTALIVSASGMVLVVVTLLVVALATEVI